MVEIMELPEYKVLGMSAKILSAMHPESKAQETIGPLWGEASWRYFGMELDREDWPLGLGVMKADPEGEMGSLIYLAGYEVRDFPDDLGELESLVVPAGKYATVTHEGPLSEMPKTVLAFYSEQLMQSGVQMREGFHLELYTEVDENGSPTKVIIAAPIL
jgi:AraC family transcriptional regulator